MILKLLIIKLIMAGKILINSFEIIGLLSGSYIGYNYGNVLKNKLLIYSPMINTYYNTNVIKKFGKFPEPMFWKLVGGFSGICISWYLNGWVLFIPIVSVELYNKYKNV